MVGRKSFINTVLRKEHLHAIGLVAAEWSLLEQMVVHSIAVTADISIDIATILCARHNFSAWTDILHNLLTVNNQHAWKSKKLDDIITRMLNLQTERNRIVHAQWNAMGVLALALAGHYPTLKAPLLSSGTGIPKRGKKITVTIEKTPTEMRAIAKAIRAVQQDLDDWTFRQPSKRQRKP